VIIGTAGHIDHGKTTLVRALTGVDTDRLKEEKERGISIDLGFAYLPAGDGSVLGFVDVPGHEKFVRNMLAGATGIDFVLLVVAADDGVMPQTVEHLAIVDLLGIARGVVALTKVDAVPPARRGEVGRDIARILAGTGLAGADLVPVSTVTGEGIAALRDRLVAEARALASRAANGRFRLSVDRSFALAGAGTVVTGTVLSGSVAVGDAVMLSPSGLLARVRAIHAQNRPAERGRAGERCGLNLAGERISKNAIARGDMVLDPDLHAPSDRIDAALRLLVTEPKPVTQWLPVRLHHAAASVGGRVVLLNEAALPPGGEGLVQLVLERPIAAGEGDRFVLRDTSGQRTIGGGRFLDLRAPTRRRRTPDRLAHLAARAEADPEAALAALLDRAPYLVDLTAFARDRALGSGDVERIAARLGLTRVAIPGAAMALSSATHERLRRGLFAALEAFHAGNPDLPGIGLERLRVQLEPRLPAPALLSLLQGLARNREVAFDGARVRLPDHRARLAPRDESLWARIAPLLAGPERFRPPRVRDLADQLDAGDADVRRLLKSLARMGAVSEVAADHFFLRESVAEMASIAFALAASAPEGKFGAAQFRDRLGTGRNIAIQILEFLDRHGVTTRRGDLRLVNARRRDLFRGPEAPRRA
jgi:selenocysteine-specific elongation factor